MKRFYGAILVLLYAVPAMSNPNYPELTVVPRASERLRTEVENEGKWSNFLPLQVSAATTLAAGLSTLNNYDEKEDSDGIGPKVAVAVGASWLAASLWLQSQHRPYSKALQSVRKLPKQELRDQLAQERMAEEHINSYASLARKIKWLSFTSNLAASAYAFSSSEEDSAGRGIAALSALASALPLLFPMRAEMVSETQNSYKKKVFGPISFSNALLLNPADNKPTFGLVVSTLR